MVWASGKVGRWDDRRNTSKVHPVPPGALTAALDSLARLRAQDPRLVQWVEDGHPTLTEAEHIARFGVSYAASRRARG